MIEERHILTMASEDIFMLDRWAVDWRAYMNARISSYVEFRHVLPDELHILERKGCILTHERRESLDRLFREVVAE